MEKIDRFSQSFLERSKNKSIKIVSHYDTDGVTSAAIVAKTLKKLDKKFTIKIVKRLDKKHIRATKNEVLLVLDLGSSHLEELNDLPNDVYIIDHHKFEGEPKEDTHLLNFGQEDNISASGLTYLFSKKIRGKDQELANLGVIGMVGDTLEEPTKLGEKVIEDASMKIKKGLQLYPATRPIHKALEFSSSLYIPGVTGNSQGVYNLLNGSGIKKREKGYKRLIDLEKEESKKLIENIVLRTNKSEEEITGNIYIVEFFDRKKDAREISAMINACSRLGHPTTALLLCLKREGAKKEVERIYANYKQRLVSALNYAEKYMQKEKTYVLLNGRDKIKDTIMGTVASILSNSKKVEDGKTIIAMAYDEDKIKISARLAGEKGKNVREVLKEIIKRMDKDYGFGGHPGAAGCQIPKSEEENFIQNMKEVLKLDIVKV